MTDCTAAVCVRYRSVFPINASYPPGESAATTRSRAMKRVMASANLAGGALPGHRAKQTPPPPPPVLPLPVQLLLQEARQEARNVE